MPPQSAYGTGNPNSGRPANGDRAAWGGYAWPGGVPGSLIGTTDYTSKFGERLRVTMRRELVPLWHVLYAVADVIGYRIYSTKGGENWGPWGYENRPVSGTSNPSGHSMALSVDINAPYNPYSLTFQSDMPVAMVQRFEQCGMYWGGRYVGQRYDPMHFGYCYPPTSVAGHLATAKSILATLGGKPPDNDTNTNDPTPAPAPALKEEIDMYLARTTDTQKREVWATVDASGVRYINSPDHLNDLKKSFPTARVTRAWYNANRAPGTGTVK